MLLSGIRDETPVKAALFYWKGGSFVWYIVLEYGCLLNDFWNGDILVKCYFY